MKFISWNVNGLRSVCKKGFTGFVLKKKPDILCLQETKLQDHQIDGSAMVPEGYQSKFASAEKAGYSGVATYLREGLAPKVKTSSGIGIKKYDQEGRFLISQHKSFLLYNVYIPSGTMGEVRQSFKYDFLDSFRDHLRSLSKADFKRLVICGDFNICHREIDIHHPDQATKRELSGFLPDERKWMDGLLKLGLVDTFRLVNGDLRDAYSWWSFRAGSRQKNLGWRIDYFLVGPGLVEKVKSAEILKAATGSDHCPVTLELEI